MSVGPRGLLALEVPLNRRIKNSFDAAEVLPHRLDLLSDFEEEIHVFLLIAPEVMHADIPPLAVAGNTTIALLKS